MIKLGSTLESIQLDINPYVYASVAKIIHNCGVAVDEEYEDSIGGGFYICEKPEDLKEIKHINGSLFDSSDIFDVAELVDIRSDYLMFAMMSNNAGGNTYYIPGHLINSYALESMEKTKIAWG